MNKILILLHINNTIYNFVSMKNIMLVILLLLVVSCTTTKYVDKPVPIETIRTEYINKYKVDTVIQLDSIDRLLKGDTVFISKYKYVYKNSVKCDTIIKNDTIEVPIQIKTTEIKEVNKLKWYQSFLMWIGFGTIVSLLVIGYDKLKRYIKI